VIESITHGGSLLASIISAGAAPAETTFLTQPQSQQQVGFVVYPAGGAVPRHTHRPVERYLVGTSEVLVVRKGACEIDVYNDEHQLVASRILRPGAVVLLVGGGHGLRMYEDTVLLEIKQGPYTGPDEKVLF
jgi:hypothetical protein